MKNENSPQVFTTSTITTYQETPKNIIGRAVASGREAEIREVSIPTDEPLNEVELTGHVENE